MRISIAFANCIFNSIELNLSVFVSLPLCVYALLWLVELPFDFTISFFACFERKKESKNSFLEWHSQVNFQFGKWKKTTIIQNMND